MMKIHEVPALMSVDTAARFLRISHLAVHEAVEAGELPVVMIDGQPAIDGRALLLQFGVDLTALDEEDEASL